MTTTDFGSSSVSADRNELILGGEIDVANASGFLDVALGVLADCDDFLTVDLSAVTFMDSTGLGMLLAVRGAAKETGKRVRLRGTPARVARLFDITGVTDLFERFNHHG
jgi:anti-sigma B factor antagonist